MWCLIMQAVLAALLGLVALRLRLPRPIRQVRDCLVGLLALTAVGLLGAALLAAQR